MGQAVAADERPCRGAVEMSEPGIAHAERYRPASIQVLRVAGVIGSREGDLMPAAIPTHGHPDGTLCCDMNRMRAESLHLPRDVKSGRDGQPDFRIAGRRNAQEALG